MNEISRKITTINGAAFNYKASSPRKSKNKMACVEHITFNRI
jgi:hypothetical protein